MTIKIIIRGIIYCIIYLFATIYGVIVGVIVGELFGGGQLIQSILGVTGGCVFFHIAYFVFPLKKAGR